MFKKNWVYARVSREVEAAIQLSAGGSLHTARAIAAQIRCASQGVGQHWPSPFTLPGMEDFAKDFAQSLAASKRFELIIRGTHSQARVSAAILKLAHDQIDIMIKSDDASPLSIHSPRHALSAGGLSAVALALQTGIALRLATHPWFDRTLAVIDFETTGFSPSDSRITEYGLVLVRNEISIETYTSLINPGIPIPKDITTITGIDDAMVADAPKEPLVMREILAALEHAQMIGGHNYTDFDSKFLNATLTRCGLEPSTLPVFDTLHLARKYILGQENYKQPTLLASLGWSGTVFHRALADAQGCAFILRAVLRSASGVDDFLDQAIPLALLDQAGLDLKTLLADSLGLGQSIAAIIPRFSDQSAAPRREVTSRSQIFCTRFHASDQECGLYLSELGSLAAGTQSQGITLLLEHVPGSAGLRTVLPQDGLILDLPGLALIVRAAPEVWKDEEVRPDGHYDLILCLDSQPVEGVAAGTLLDMRLNPLALRA